MLQHPRPVKCPGMFVFPLFLREWALILEDFDGNKPLLTVGFFFGLHPPEHHILSRRSAYRSTTPHCCRGDIPCLIYWSWRRRKAVISIFVCWTYLYGFDCGRYHIVKGGLMACFRGFWKFGTMSTKPLRGLSGLCGVYFLPNSHGLRWILDIKTCVCVFMFPSPLCCALLPGSSVPILSKLPAHNHKMSQHFFEQPHNDLITVSRIRRFLQFTANLAILSSTLGENCTLVDRNVKPSPISPIRTVGCPGSSSSRGM